MKTIVKTAYHEAGHIVASDLMGKANKHASIILNETSSGRSISSIFYEDFNIENFSIYKIDDYNEFFKAVVINLAGFVSEHIASGRRSFSVATGDTGDLLELGIKFELPDKLVEVMFTEAELYLRDLFEYPFIWELVKTIAEALLIKKELNQAEIADIIENSVYYAFVHEEPYKKNI